MSGTIQSTGMVSPPSCNQIAREARRKWLIKLLAVPVYVAVAILMVNQRVGWDDDQGAQLLPIILRTDTWAALAIVLAALIVPRWASVPAPFKATSNQILIQAPLLFLLFTLLASFINGVINGLPIDVFGAGDLFKGVLCAGLSYLVFKLTLSHEDFGHRVVNILIWSSVANMTVGFLAVGLQVNNIPGFNTGPDGGLVGAGFIGLGGRFQGLGSNANIAMTQTGIALALLIPRILYQPSPWKKAGLMVYGIGLCVIMAWTGVRAALVIWPTIFLVLLWLRFRFKWIGLMNIAGLFMQIALFVGLGWVASAFMDIQSVLLERLEGGDGRLFLWEHYFDLLIHNPLGLGLGFESIVGTDSIIEGQRLPPHNALLQAGMYAGIGGVAVSVFLILRIGLVFVRLKRFLDRSPVALDLMGLTLAWCSLVVSVMFAGLLQTDFNFSIVTALLLGIAARSGVFSRRAPRKARPALPPASPQVGLNS